MFNRLTRRIKYWPSVRRRRELTVIYDALLHVDHNGYLCLPVTMTDRYRWVRDPKVRALVPDTTVARYNEEHPSPQFHYDYEGPMRTVYKEAFAGRGWFVYMSHLDLPTISWATLEQRCLNSPSAGVYLVPKDRIVQTYHQSVLEAIQDRLDHHEDEESTFRQFLSTLSPGR